MTEILAATAALCAASAMIADRGGVRRRPFYLLKPLTTILIIGIAWLAEPASPEYRQWVLVALVLSLAGDIALMFHGNRWFIAGLLSFLVAHIAFIFAFIVDLPGLSPPWWSFASPLIGMAFLPLLWPGAGKLRPAIGVYGLALCAMVIAAAARYSAHPGTAALLAVAGAVLFQISDSTLAYRRFVKPFPGGQVATLSTYWLAIGLVALSI